MENSLPVLIIVLLLINFAAFIYVGVDKRKSIQQTQRVPEVNLFFISVFFAALGVFLGMFFFRHKTRKIHFPLGIGFLFIQQITLLILILNNV